MTNKINIFLFLLFFIFSCAPYSPSSSVSTSSSKSYSVENIEKSIAPKYESGDIKYTPIYSTGEYIRENFDYEAIAFDTHTKLFDVNTLCEDDVRILLTTWKTADGIPLTKGLEEIDLGGYLGHYLDKILYLMSNGFESKHLGKLLEEIDSNKDFSPSKIIACGHNFQSRMLMEIGESVKHYSNKKDIDVEFLTRY